ncbi:RNA polymerase sigma factor [Tautonia rosea]|uniref:RNA polymerase sigma factor n=1 Tax=Tautonia rosea TaxID=2728037 RepID=UPI001472AB16|nr:sigma-70 family RNA polymerase sigma factor [Tautonia rosea]
MEPRTSLSLLDRLRENPHSEEAWAEFLARYGKVLYRWCRRWGLQPSDAEDVTQDTLLAVARQIKDFRYDPDGSFRAWMKTIAYRFWIRVVERSSRQAATGGSAALEELASVAARDDLARFCEAQAREVLLEQAFDRVRQRVSPSTWDAFRLTALEDLPGSEVARQLGLSVGDVYNARWRVQKFVREAVRELDPDA